MGKRPLERSRRRLEDNIEIDLYEVGYRQMPATVNAVMNLRISHKAGNFLTSSETVGLSRRILLRGVSCLFVLDFL